VTDAPAAASFSALGTTATVAVVDHAALPAARELLGRLLDVVDLTCSRFRADSELVRVNRGAGETSSISSELTRFLRFALEAAEATNGRVDPTLGVQLRRAGYDRTFSLVRARDTWQVVPKTGPQPSWESISLDETLCTVRVPRGVELDLGATAKAVAADDAAITIAAACKTGVLVSLGGDLAVAGDPPTSGWAVQIADDHMAKAGSGGPTVLVRAGGLATSSTTVRRWRTDGGDAHHILDPRTSRPAVTPWRTITVAAATCFEANLAATAAVVLGDGALEWLRQRRVPARCVRRDGTVVPVGGWPSEVRAA
jgi:thiamine biosynthesis lipoprotein